jgi:RNA polymerase sigma factor (sigma-70 family)
MVVTEDTSLIQNILDGDERSEEKLYEKYRKIIGDYLKSKYPNDQTLEDDVSEILIKIFLSLPSYDLEKSKFKSWVFTIANNHMIDKSRSFDVLCGTITLDCVGDSITISNSGDYVTTSDVTNWNPDENNVFYTSSYATDFENCDTLNHISNSIESCDFTFLNMKYSEGYNYNEIGVEFNMTSNTISNRVNYVKSKLKNNLDLEE